MSRAQAAAPFPSPQASIPPRSQTALAVVEALDSVIRPRKQSVASWVVLVVLCFLPDWPILPGVSGARRRICTTMIFMIPTSTKTNSAQRLDLTAHPSNGLWINITILDQSTPHPTFNASVCSSKHQHHDHLRILFVISEKGRH